MSILAETLKFHPAKNSTFKVYGNTQLVKYSSLKKLIIGKRLGEAIS